MLDILENDFSVIRVFFFNFLILSVRYLIFAGLAFFIFWVWKKDKFSIYRIQQKFPESEKIFFEIKYSFLTFFIFACVGVGIYLARKSGYTLIYSNIDEYGWGYFFFSILASILLHDTYFYWMHRLIHHKWLFKKVHAVHHNSTNPSPWAAFSFHPFEAILEAGILPILVFILPLHIGAIVIFLLFMTILNVLGHLGYEFYPRNFVANPLTNWNNTSFHHNQHHQKFNCNYGLYFNWWDKICKTNHIEYQKQFEEFTSLRDSFKKVK
jgi:sterol desaturase/sphingolipid hydroxylase (fatty acid hydroxylase superfamily)